MNVTTVLCNKDGDECTINIRTWIDSIARIIQYAADRENRFASCSLHIYYIFWKILKDLDIYLFDLKLRTVYPLECIILYAALPSRSQEMIARTTTFLFRKDLQKWVWIIDRLFYSFRNSTISSKHFGKIGAFSKALRGVTSINLSIAPNSKSFYSI